MTLGCAGCRSCADHKFCEPARGKLRSYTGLRFTSDGFDCALPVSIDSHSHCSYACMYCFSDNLTPHREQTMRPIGQMGLGTIERLFSGEGESRELGKYRSALKYDRKRNGYPCPIQLGAINDPCDNIERHQGWLLKFIPLAIKYKQPVRISTKGTLLREKPYMAALKEGPDLFWVSFSIISANDELVGRIDAKAPVPTERIKTMRELAKNGVRTALRLRPILPNISKDYRTLIEKCVDAGAYAISYEVGFYPGTAAKDVKKRWQTLSEIAKFPFEKVYRQFGHAPCIRPPYTWTEEVMHDIHDLAHKHGLVVGVSDPVWKQLTDTGCCCGMLPDDPIWGNWQEESATNQLLVARDTGKVVGPNDVIPKWAWEAEESQICSPGVGPRAAFRHRHARWGNRLRKNWNDLASERGPLKYFQGALLPVEAKDGDLFFKYEGLKRAHRENRFFKEATK